MAFLRGITNHLWNYVSPRKTQQKREKPFAFKKPAIPVRNPTPPKDLERAPTRQISPEAHATKQEPRSDSPQQIDFDAMFLPPSPPASAMLSEDLEGDTLLTESPIGVKAGGSSADEWDANEETMVVDDGTYMEQHKRIDVEIERVRRDQQGRDLRDAGWSEDAVFLFQKLGMRGFEPLLPISWINDFETVPEDLFTEKLDKAFIKPAFGTDYSAQNALNRLFDLGGFVRDAWHTRAKRTPAFHIGKAVKAYTKWAMKDGRVDHLWARLPLFHTVTFSRHVHPSVGEEKMVEKLGRLYELWYEALQIEQAELRGDTIVPDVPTLYGITASHSVMAFVSYAPPTEMKEQPQLRLIAMFDFAKEGYDVWNSLAMAIFIIHCRNRMMQLTECLSEPEVSTEEDPDL
ncbi:hypothetical protein PtrSN002B_002142 [Pyrenophora tritici-repentis]|uniref:Uncharacterized protein n=2 Tax=Pyrenophora tritici-repentis TaxID=45151 RepID=A0A2W1D2S2_9PLEO|nr:uncharacterized protein PTRG_08811 [Pyrenophora tritici-repentis Pt-1C-BFP]KAA8627382.1 hypothetical protein PtrV1_03062 [Pyrenophora tritici-repentis]EDU41862.1 predicted protein [Pyrenophora tritici-repentis Pt-1C-BFP]KAF7442588.1 hypothetical protein A1F99_134570 [Pyrenophora tritici-repentis]KAF7579033.1 hypothetical protein PtrM4_032730 [Pyrenophora tritici-repentis]KAG9377964.1 hypothetical protein A1F94_011080 [Pyrenophora tritici-repentis]